MKNTLLTICILFITSVISNSYAQNNIPDLNDTLAGSPTHVVTKPLDFTSVSPSWPTSELYNYVRVYRPYMPMTVLPKHENLGSYLMTVNTTYLNGWGQTMLNVSQPNQYVPAIYTPIDNRASTTQVSYLPYPAPDNIKKGKFRMQPYTEQKNYYASKFPKEGETGYSKTVLENTNGIQKVKSFVPGEEFTGENIGTTVSVHAAHSYELPSAIYSQGTLILTYDPSVKSICSTGIYGSNQITVKWTEGQEGQEVFESYDKSGKLICKRTPNGSSGYYTTYYVYNELGQLTHIIPPTQTANLIANICLTNVSPTTYPAEVFAYEYNEYGQVIKSQTPGKEGFDRVVYDQYNRPFLSQSPDLADSGKAYFTLYDKNGRTLITGIFNEIHDMRQSYYDSIVNGDTSLHNYLDGQSQAIADDLKLEYWLLHDLTVNDYPEDQSGEPFMAACEIHTINYYDNYDSDPANLVSFYAVDTTLFESGVVSVKPEPYYLVHGKLVASKTRILDNGIVNNWGTREWITSVHFYDERGNAIQTHTLNPWQTSEWDILTNQYGFTGQVLRSIMHHKGNISGTSNEIAVYNRNGYQVGSGMPVNSAIKIDTFDWRGISRAELGDMNQVKELVLGESEKQRLTYNMRGQLKGINAVYLYSGALGNSNKATYASELNYETGFDKSRHDGKLTGYQWRTAGSTNPMSYGYDYDDAGRMTYAEYRYYDIATTSWIKNDKDYTVSNLSYDANGNIQSMTQRGDDTSSTPAPTDIDVLSYTYDATGTHLTGVVDIGNPSSTRIHDFEDGTNSGADYLYSKNGNLTTDNNRGIDVNYNFQDLPQKITKGTSDVQNIYTADGTLLQKIVTDNVNSTVDTFHYWGPLVYKNDTVQMVMHGTGRIRNSDTGWAYDYFVKDHLGNVRTIVTGDKSFTTIPYSASFEAVSSTLEEAIFDQIGAVRDLSPLGTPGDLESGILNGAISNERIGAALLVHAMAGEKFNVKGYGYYESDDTAAYNMYPMEGHMLTSLTDALTANAITGEGGATALSNINSMMTSTNYSAYETMKLAATNTSYPRAYLNYLVFDDNHDIQTQYSHVVQIQGATNSWQLMEVVGDIEMPITGYILAYFSNESDMEVAVDNIHVVEYKSELLEAQHYYPHGLVIEDGGHGLTNPLNKYLAQGNKLQEELGIFINDFNFRQYDAQIGRFMAVDPLASNSGQEVLNPYQFCFNDPGNYTDPLGLDPWSWLTGLFGGGNGPNGQQGNFPKSSKGKATTHKDGSTTVANDFLGFGIGTFINSISGEAVIMEVGGGQRVGGTAFNYIVPDVTDSRLLRRYYDRYIAPHVDKQSKIMAGITAESNQSQKHQDWAILILNREGGELASGWREGHTALVVGSAYDEYTLFSNDGDEKGAIGALIPGIGEMKPARYNFSTWHTFLANELSEGYTEFLFFPISHENSQKIKAVMKDIIKKGQDYNIFYNTCLDCTMKGLSEINITFPLGSFSPNKAFDNLKSKLPDHYYGNR